MNSVTYLRLSVVDVTNLLRRLLRFLRGQLLLPNRSSTFPRPSLPIRIHLRVPTVLRFLTYLPTLFQGKAQRHFQSSSMTNPPSLMLNRREYADIHSKKG